MPGGISSSEQITVRCACGTKLKAPASAVGRKAKCPKCGAVLTVQPPPLAPEPEPVALGDGDELGANDEDGMYGLADDPQPAARSGSVVPAPAAPPPVPAMPMPMSGPVGAVRPLDASGGVPMGVPPGMSPYPPPPIPTNLPVTNPQAKPVEGGSFVKGLGLSLAFTFVGALVWFGIAAVADREHSWIALGVGVLAGLGMAKGYGSRNALSGLTASFIAILGIVVGKLFVFFLVLLPTFDRLTDFDDPDGARERVVFNLTEQELRAKGIDPDEDDYSERQWNEAEKAAQAKVDAMSDAAVEQADAAARAEWDKAELTELLMFEVLEEQGLDYADTNEAQDAAAMKTAEERVARMTPEQQKAELERLSAEAEVEGEEEVGFAFKAIAYSVLFFFTCFGLMDILFVVLAVASAFKVATAGTEA